MAGATVLDQVVTFTGVASGATVALPHGINLNGTPAVPDLAFRDNGNFTIVSVTTTTVTVTNNALIVQTLSLYLWKRHTIERAYGAVQIDHLIPQPFVPAASGSSGGGASTRQTFRYTATGAETDDFVLTLPVPRLDLLYNAVVTGGGLAFLLDFETVAADNTLTTFHVLASAVLTAGDVLMITVDQLTS